MAAGGNEQISDFAPNSTNALITSAPEAGSGALALAGIVFPVVGFIASRRRARSL